MIYIQKEKADLLLHPIRMRMIRAFIGRKLTAQQLSELLSDVPQATLYRHLKKLQRSGILRVIQKRPIRGALERVYTLVEGKEILPHLSDQLTEDNCMQDFLLFLANLQSDFERYLQQSNPDFKKDGVHCQQVHVHLSDEEFKKLWNKWNELISEALHKEPRPGRRTRILSMVVIPDPY